MTLSKRETNIAIGLGVTVLLVVLWSVALSPYLDAIGAINKDIQTEQKQSEEDSSVLSHSKHLQKVWAVIEKGGLAADQSKAETQALNAASDWAYAAGVNITALKSERTTDAGPFLIIGFHVTGNASMSAIHRMLLSFETATIPVRVNDMQITPRKEGTGDLTIQMSLSTLCLKAGQPAGKTALTRAGWEAQSWN